MSAIKPRVSGVNRKLDKVIFIKRFQEQFQTEEFNSLRPEIEKVSEAAWMNYQQGSKAPVTQKAGLGHADPDYELSLEWIKTRDAIQAAKKIHQNSSGPPRILLISASNRNDQTCAGEISKTIRLTQLALTKFTENNCLVDFIDLSELTHEYEKKIYPCKGCVSTAMPLCHWPCSCYPNHKLGQVNDWMNDIYPQWVKAHGVMIITPVYWHQAPSSLKLMMDRLVCADGGNPDPTSTQGKSAKLAKEIEMKGWNYPRHLAGRCFSVVVHGDAVGVDDLKGTLCDWLEEMELIPSGNHGNIGRYIGYYGTYAESHEALDKDKDIQKEVMNAAEALVGMVKLKRKDHSVYTLPGIEDTRPK